MIIRPMKGAAVDDLTLIRLPCIAFPKIDGFRCVLDHRYPLTSRLSRFPNSYFHNELSGVLPEGRILDGEVVVGKRRGPGVLQRTSSGLTSVAGEPDFRLWVFDDPSCDSTFEDRYESAEKRVRRAKDSRIRLLECEVIHTYDQLVKYLDKCLKRGFEGIITRLPEGQWKDGKSTLNQQWMLKVKPFDTAEGRVKGWYEEEQNTNVEKRDATGKLKRSSAKAGKVAKGQLGGLILEDVKTKVEVRVGGGYSLSQRRALWRIIQRDPNQILGALVRYKKQAVGEKNKPRHPNFVEFVDFRPEWDMSD